MTIKEAVELFVERDIDKVPTGLIFDNIASHPSDWKYYDAGEWMPVSFFPDCMWGWMFSFSSTWNEEWAVGSDYYDPHLDEMEECGFHLFLSDEYGLYFGIDGGGYSFIEAHWTPLYHAIGLKWHTNWESETEGGDMNE